MDASSYSRALCFYPHEAPCWMLDPALLILQSCWTVLDAAPTPLLPSWTCNQATGFSLQAQLPCAPSLLPACPSPSPNLLDQVCLFKACWKREGCYFRVHPSKLVLDSPSVCV
ncbi:hypothetical protein VIGAN_09117800 [Vigna angularis var. angularis]|uniref:Uncharacterized protein n=1 Tax=Vigna angularis var. angularis TaxID=157739 RepID=A0A0S3SY78_PHAAN|nr:hypothetical protein VIGAN_09117800 [Vigna angularis var. angularis]